MRPVDLTRSDQCGIESRTGADELGGHDDRCRLCTCRMNEVDEKADDPRRICAQCAESPSVDADLAVLAAASPESLLPPIANDAGRRGRSSRPPAATRPSARSKRPLVDCSSSVGAAGAAADHDDDDAVGHLRTPMPDASVAINMGSPRLTC